ncbi:MAG: Ser-Thr-rich GPI-anchored membrane family protein, partial [Promethearchaeota archaeon]
SGSYAYVADSFRGLEIIDISDSSTPMEVGQYDDGGYTKGVYVSGSYAYMADGSDGLEILYLMEIEYLVEIITPNRNSIWEKDISHLISWNSSKNFPSVCISLYNSGSFLQNITQSTPNNGNYNWSIPSSLLSSTEYQIRIKSNLHPSIYDTSDYFQIKGPPSKNRSIPSYNLFLFLGIIIIIILGFSISIIKERLRREITSIH